MIARWFVHTITVETFIGAGSQGDVFAAPVLVKGWLEDSQALIRSTFGQEVIAQSVFYTSLGNAALFTTDARVTVNGRISRVVKVNVNDSGGLMPNVEHVAVALT